MVTEREFLDWSRITRKHSSPQRRHWYNVHNSQSTCRREDGFCYWWFRMVADRWPGRSPRSVWALGRLPTRCVEGITLCRPCSAGPWLPWVVPAPRALPLPSHLHCRVNSCSISERRQGASTFSVSHELGLVLLAMGAIAGLCGSPIHPDCLDFSTAPSITACPRDLQNKNDWLWALMPKTVSYFSDCMIIPMPVSFVNAYFLA